MKDKAKTTAENENILTVQKYEGLALEPPTKDIVEVSVDEDDDAITKEEEWIKKKKTELTTTRQIETRVKRQVVLEDGKVIEDSGPIVSTNTTEDTEKQETETTERRNLGDKDEIDAPKAIEENNENLQIAPIANTNTAMVHTKVSRPDGLVRQTKEQKVISREEIDEIVETEDVKYMGDFSDEAYIKAVNSGVENIKSTLLSPNSQKQIIEIGPRIVNQSVKSKKTVDTEDTELKCIAQADGKLVTEKKKTTEHEVLIDEDLPERDNKSNISDGEKIEHKESSQHYHKQRDEQTVDFVANGKIIGTEMRYAAENEFMERDGAHENPSDWDSLSDRVRKNRKTQKTLLQQHKGISDWSERERNENTRKNFPSQSFKDELKATLENKHKLSKQISLPVSKDEIKYIKPINEQSLYSRKEEQNIRHTSRDDSDDSRFIRLSKDDPGYMSGSRNDLRYIRSNSRDELQKNHVAKDMKYYRNGHDSISHEDGSYVIKSNYVSSKNYRSPTTYTPDSGIRSPTPDNIDEQSNIHPVAPQRKRALQRKMKIIDNDEYIAQIEPRPDYSPPPPSHIRSRSESPHIQNKYQHQNGNAKKQFQKTRFKSETRSIQTQPTSIVNTNTMTKTTNNPPQWIKNSNATTQTQKSNKVGSVIGNSIRKLVGKIRSASAERKLKMKSKQRSPSPEKSLINTKSNMNGSTYQQYNIIDGHIGQQQQQNQIRNQQNQLIDSRETSICSSGRRERIYERRGSSDLDMMNPKQRYYLGEDPYGGSIYGKENKYDANARMQRNGFRRNKTEEPQPPPHTPDMYLSSPRINTTTLGRFSNSSNRLITNNHHSVETDNYRTVQTLPRKLERKPAHSSTINVSIVNSVQPNQNTGPAKPLRTYKSLNRSKSFNVHGLNGTNDPSPIYLSKLTNNYGNSFHKSNPHLNEAGIQLKSPSIVNLVSRSQRDLTRIDDSDFRQNGGEKYKNFKNSKINNNNNFNGSVDIVDGLNYNGYASPQKYRMEKIGSRDIESSLGSNSPITINKDTAGIIRRNSSSTDDYNETYKYITTSDDPLNPSVTNTIQNFSKKTIPMKNGNSKETIEKSEIKTVTTSRYRSDKPISNIRYHENEKGCHAEAGPVIIELRNNNNIRRK